MKNIIKKTNITTKIKSITKVVLIAFIMCFTGLVFQSCKKDKPVKPIPIDPNRQKNVLLLYVAGANNLSEDYQQNIKDLTNELAHVPSNKKYDDVLLVYSKFNYKNSSHLVRYTKDNKNVLHADTLHTYSSKYVSASSSTLNKVLTDVNEMFPDSKYGMIFSSHGTGWIPASNVIYHNGNLAQKDSYNNKSNTNNNSIQPQWIGDEYANGLHYNINLTDFNEAIPMHLEYILFDCCLMGSIEVCYELKNNCNKIIASPTEILAEGFDYTIMGENLLNMKDPNLQAVCEAYYNKYLNKVIVNEQSATVSLIDCSKLKEVANAYANIIKDYKNNIYNVDYHNVQEYYYTSNKHWFYDMYDIAVQSNVPEEKLIPLKTAIDNCIIYKAHTPKFIGLEIEKFSGLSMYLPTNYLFNYNHSYKKLAWNKDVGLVK